MSESGADLYFLRSSIRILFSSNRTQISLSTACSSSPPSSLNDMSYPALLLTEGWLPDEVADALPNFIIPPPVEAGLIRTWNQDFAAKVLCKWAPANDTWIEYLKSSKDDTASLSLILTTLSLANTRRVISAAACGSGPRLAQLMKALRLAQTQPTVLNPRPVSNPSPIPQTSTSAETDEVRLSSVQPSHSFEPTVPPNPSLLRGAQKSPPAPSSAHSISPSLAQQSRDQLPHHPAELSFSPFDSSLRNPIHSHSQSRLATTSGRLLGADRTTEPQRQARQPTPVPNTVDEELPSAELGPSSHRWEPKRFPLVDGNPLGSDSETESAYGVGKGDSDNEEDDSFTEDGEEDSESQEDSGTGRETGVNDADADGDEDVDKSLEGFEDNVHEDETGHDIAPDGYTEPSLNPWTWTQNANDKKVAQWGLEELIQDDRRSTAAARTEWMYEARLGSEYSPPPSLYMNRPDKYYKTCPRKTMRRGEKRKQALSWRFPSLAETLSVLSFTKTVSSIGR